MPRWLVCYVLLGVVQTGLLPVILPLSSPPGPAQGLTYAAFAAAGIAAPFVGAFSDRHRRHRLTLACGLGLAGLAMPAHAFLAGTAAQMATAALAGLGVSSASTVGTMFIVEVEPRERWEGMIGTLQACLGGGQLAGLLLAGALGTAHIDAAFLAGGALLLLAVPLALALAPDPVTKVERPTLAQGPARGGDAAPMGPQRSLHRLTWRALAGLRHDGLTWFLAAWLLSYTATNGLSVMFAVAMVRQYHLAATLPTAAYAVGVGISLLLYRGAGAWDKTYGPWRLLDAGLGARIVVIAGMAALAASHAQAATLALLACFAATQVIWPLLAVASNTLAVTLSPGHQAESVGLLNAATSVGATIGGILGGVILRAGFGWLCGAVAAALAVSLLLAWHPKMRLDA
jgi:MFS family permease